MTICISWMTEHLYLCISLSPWATPKIACGNGVQQAILNRVVCHSFRFCRRIALFAHLLFNQYYELQNGVLSFCSSRDWIMGLIVIEPNTLQLFLFLLPQLIFLFLWVVLKGLMFCKKCHHCSSVLVQHKEGAPRASGQGARAETIIFYKNGFRLLPGSYSTCL